MTLLWRKDDSTHVRRGATTCKRADRHASCEAVSTTREHGRQPPPLPRVSRDAPTPALHTSDVTRRGAAVACLQIACRLLARRPPCDAPSDSDRPRLSPRVSAGADRRRGPHDVAVSGPRKRASSALIHILAPLPAHIQTPTHSHGHNRDSHGRGDTCTTLIAARVPSCARRGARAARAC